jgi:hypothetical protein
MDVLEFLARLLRFVVLGFAVSRAFAGTIDPNTPDSKYLEFGKQFPSVARLRATVISKTDDGKEIKTPQYGSAVIIRPHWVLTAAHVVEGTHKSTVIVDSGHEYPLAAVIMHADFDAGKLGYHDLALGYSAKDFELEFYTPLYRESDELGKAVTISGYGLTGTFHTGAKISDDKKRAGHNKVEGMMRSVLICNPDKHHKFPLEFIIAPGDSGGGLFIGNELAGINSFLMADDKKPDATYGDESAYTRVSLYATWIEKSIEQFELKLQGRATTGDIHLELENALTK